VANAVNSGLRIHYRVVGAGAPLVLQHGLSDSIESWHEYGYVDGLERDRTLILIDARGHGQSDKPHDPDAYARTELVADVVAVLDDLGIERAAFYGHSMGGHIGFDVARYAPNRLSALVVSGADAFRAPPSAPRGSSHSSVRAPTPSPAPGRSWHRSPRR
jgi:pimeloyl-ACP methyl ester carboxylesterase